MIDAEPTQQDPPVHDCPIQGADTPLVRAWNPTTGEQKWICIWCEMANQMLGGQR